ncbi:MAG: hypothetical protein ABR976_07020 [Terracidiphilus sp.]|jgi:hypothetical protein
MKSRVNNDPGQKISDAETPGPPDARQPGSNQPDSRQTVRRVQITVEREVTSVLLRPGPPQSGASPQSSHQNWTPAREINGVEICSHCGQVLPAAQTQPIQAPVSVARNLHDCASLPKNEPNG